jgi:hypothetical protein
LLRNPFRAAVGQIATNLPPMTPAAASASFSFRPQTSERLIDHRSRTPSRGLKRWL